MAEGITVKEGEFVASLDNSTLTGKINDQQINIDKINAQIKQAQLDTALDLRALRDEIVNLNSDLQQKLLEKEQSKYEAPAEIKRVQLDYERVQRTLKQKEEAYKTKQIQAATRLQILNSDFQQQQNFLDKLSTLMGQLRIMAPKTGMVIYEKNWNGQKKSVGSLLEIWEPTVASLPDLSQMEVVTYVNEVDIQKIKVGQKVEISLDAAAGKKLDGIVTNVANIGEEKPNSDAKVFEVVINVLTKDDMLRPAMTASCKILAERYENVLQVPLDAIFTMQQTSYVYKIHDNSTVRQEVKVFTVNETNALVSNGLIENDKIYYSMPKDTTGMKMTKMDTTKNVIPKQLIKPDSSSIKQNSQPEQQGKVNG